MSYSITPDPNTLSLNASERRSVLVSLIQGDGSAGQKRLTLPDLPTGMTGVFSGNPIKSNGGVTTLTLTRGASLPPAVESAVIDAAGTTLTLVFSQSVTGVDAADYQLSGHTLSSAMGSGDTWTFTISPAVYDGDVRTLSYDGTASLGTDDVPLEAFSGAAVTNNSTQVAAPVDVEPARYGDSDNALFLKWAMRVQDPPSPPSPPVNLSAPVITSSSTEGSQPLNVESEGTWSNSPTSFTYQWHDNGGPIPDATESYHFGNAPSSFHCEVTAINAGGSSSLAQSNTITLS